MGRKLTRLFRLSSSLPTLTRSAPQPGCLSIMQLDQIDRSSPEAVATRVEEGFYGGAAFQYVIDSCTQLFELSPVCAVLEPHTIHSSKERPAGREADISAEAERLRKENATLQIRIAKGAVAPLSLEDRREPCANWNSRGGCQRGSACKYAHVCNFATKLDGKGEPLEYCRAEHTRAQHP
jgi:hypothetical protein